MDNRVLSRFSVVANTGFSRLGQEGEMERRLEKSA